MSEHSHIIPHLVQMAKDCKELYKKHADFAKMAEEGTGGWMLNNGYRNNSNGTGKNAAICIELQYVLCELTSIGSLFKANLPKFDGHIQQHWTTAQYHFNRVQEKLCQLN